MEYDDFKTAIEMSIPVDKVFTNPGGGTSTIRAITDEYIRYQRGNAQIRVAIEDLYDAYSHYSGTDVSGSDLRDYNPGVFDSKRKGHDCNRSFLFLVLQQLELCGEILGTGTRGDPFYVHIES